MYQRTIKQTIKSNLFQGKAIIIYGARQVGKTTLCKEILSEYKNVFYLTGDDPYTGQLLSNKSISDYQSLFGEYRIICIDEAQNITNIGSILKLLVDNIPSLQVIATGSSSFDLANKVNEPLTGRADIYHLHPLSVGEIINSSGKLGFDQLLQQRIIFGMYPDSVKHNTQKILQTLSENYVYKDIFARDFIKKSDLITTILKALAFQIGNQVSYNEIAQIVQSDVKTVQKYIYLLEQAFIIFRLPSYAKNLRNELKKSQKIYFWDIGIRNGIIRNFAPLDLRDDVGALRENWVISEMMKKNMNEGYIDSYYFWRTTQQQEVDIIVERGGTMRAFEIKRSSQKKVTWPKSFTEGYPDYTQSVITRDNYLQFLQ